MGSPRRKPNGSCVRSMPATAKAAATGCASCSTTCPSSMDFRRSLRSAPRRGILNRYFQTAGTSEIATGRASPRLLGQFSAHSLTVTRGMTDTDPWPACAATSASSPTIGPRCPQDRFRPPTSATANAGSADVHGLGSSATSQHSMIGTVRIATSPKHWQRSGTTSRPARAISRTPATPTPQHFVRICWGWRAISDG